MSLRYAKQAVPLAFDALAERHVNPPGKFDNAGRWYPSENFTASCCSHLRGPSRAHPYSYMTHCRTKKHLQTLWNESPQARDTIRDMAVHGTAREPQRACPDGKAYKQVAVADDGKFLSVYNGTTEYQIGQEIKQQVRQGHNGGFYVYETAEDAKNARFPSSSAALHMPRRLIVVTVAGNYCRYDNGKLAFGSITPTRIIQEM